MKATIFGILNLVVIAVVVIVTYVSPARAAWQWDLLPTFALKVPIITAQELGGEWKR